MPKMNTYVYVTSEFIATHSWPGCPYPEVAFLKFPHRHKFFVKVTFRVSGDDREIEFFMAKQALEHLLSTYHNKDLGSLSCEMMAKSIYTYMDFEVGTVRSVSVSEDAENGSIVEIENEPTDF